MSVNRLNPVDVLLRDVVQALWDTPRAQVVIADHLNARLDAEIAELGRPGMTASDLAPLLSEDLRSLYWRRKLDIYFAKELGEVAP